MNRKPELASTDNGAIATLDGVLKVSSAQRYAIERLKQANNLPMMVQNPAAFRLCISC